MSAPRIIAVVTESKTTTYTSAFCKKYEDGGLSIENPNGAFYYPPGEWKWILENSESEWISAEVLKPENRLPVLVSCVVDECEVVTFALYMDSEEQFDPEYPDECDEYWCEEREAYFTPPGWYEVWVTSDDRVWLDNVTHWKVSPKTPSECLND